jgi:hypothetical protein
LGLYTSTNSYQFSIDFCLNKTKNKRDFHKSVGAERDPMQLEIDFFLEFSFFEKPKKIENWSTIFQRMAIYVYSFLSSQKIIIIDL